MTAPHKTRKANRELELEAASQSESKCCDQCRGTFLTQYGQNPTFCKNAACPCHQSKCPNIQAYGRCIMKGCGVCGPGKVAHSQKDWQNTYPLNTFTGETKRELVELVQSLLQSERNELYSKIEGMKKPSFMMQQIVTVGDAKLDRSYKSHNSALDQVLSLIKPKI